MTSFASTSQAFMEVTTAAQREEESSNTSGRTTGSFEEATDLVTINEEGKIAVRWEDLLVNKWYPIEAYGKSFLVVRRPGDTVQIHELVG